MMIKKITYINLTILLMLVSVGCEENQPPIIIGLHSDPGIIEKSGNSTLTCLADDPDGDNLSYSWTVALGDIIGSGNQVRYTAAFCCVGVNTINIIVKDSRGATVKGSINLEVNP